MSRREANFKNAAYRLIDQLLASILNQTIPDETIGAAQVDLYVIDRVDAAPVRGRSGYSLIKSVGHRRRASAGSLRNQPLADWDAFWPSFREGRHRLLGPLDFRASRMRDRYRTIGMSRMLGCPVVGPEGTVTGAMLTVWTGGAVPPAGTGLSGTIASAMRVAGQVSAVLDLYRHATAAAASAVSMTQDGCLV